MRVNINTPYGENIFELPADKVIALIRQAFAYAENNNTPGVDTPTGAGFIEKETRQETVEEEKQAEKTPLRDNDKWPERHTRNDSLFGTGWRNQNTNTKEIDDAQREFGRIMEGYKGFLYIQCPECGKIKGFCTKSNIKEHTCECGHSFQLEHLKPMYVHCKCGKDFKYYTNIEADDFEYQCINCGAPVDMHINTKGTAYVTDRSISGGYY